MVLNINDAFQKIHFEFFVGILPIIYLLTLLHRGKFIYNVEEIAYLTFSLMLIVLIRLVYMGTYIFPLISPIELLALLPGSLATQFQFVGMMCLLFVHVSLLASFLMLVFKQKENELKLLGDTDSLTGVYNRKAFFEKVSTIDNCSERFFIMIDADYFKEVNDNYDHIVGDKALKHITDVVQGCISKHDILARYGGEEFIIAVANCSSRDVIKIAERICRKMAATPLLIDNMKIDLTLSIGVSTGYAADSLEDIKRADQMLYKAKQSDRNRVVYSFA